MKLQELAVVSPTKQAAKVFESYFGNSVPFEQLSKKQAQHMLTRVRGLIAEHRRQPAFHKSEQNPAYLKLVVMEQGLTGMVREFDATMGTAPADAAKQAALMTAQQQQKKRTLQDQLKQVDAQVKALTAQRAEIQKAMNMPTMAESRLVEGSDVQQAQVVLASQDMVDQVQKMIEQVTSMQFKDLPALVDQVKNQMGPDQAMKFNQDVTTALTSLTQNLQGSKTQLDAALGVVTGQAPTIPGEDLGAVPAPELGGEELPAEPTDDEEEIDVDLDAEIEEPGKPTDLGRTRR